MLLRMSTMFFHSHHRTYDAYLCAYCLCLSKQLLPTRPTPLLTMLLLLLLQVVAPLATPAALAQQMMLTCHQAVKMITTVTTTASCVRMPVI
jgi:hypothetical protein